MNFWQAAMSRVRAAKVKIVHGLGGGHGQVLQDKNYVSRVSDADFAAFQAIPDMTKAKVVASMRHLRGTDGNDVQIVEDMRLAPTRYGFADTLAAAAWINEVELSKD